MKISLDEISMPGLTSRQVAWEVLVLVASGSYADVSLDRVLSRYVVLEKDKALATELAFGAIRKRKLLDCWIDFLAKFPSIKQPPKLRWLLHIGLYQIFCMSKIPYSAAVNTTVELAKKNQLKGLANLINAILRSAIRAKESGFNFPLSNNPSEKIAQLYSLPNWLADNLIKWRGEAESIAIAKSFNEVPPIDIRINSLRSGLEETRALFSNAGIESRTIKERSYGLQVFGSGRITNWPGYKEGFWCIQDRSSQWISPLLDPKPGERVLDACAAPGGKSTHMAELMQDTGEIWAIDRSMKRLEKVIQNSKRLGIKSIKTLASDASSIVEQKSEWKGYFQRILIDAPCSGLGTLSRNPDARWRMSPESIKELVALQSKLLNGILPMLSPRGRLVYSTCTINPDENSNQILNFLKDNPKLNLIEENQIWPNLLYSGDGFYSAVMEID